jgi:hypothetical protein
MGCASSKGDQKCVVTFEAVPNGVHGGVEAFHSMEEADEKEGLATSAMAERLLGDLTLAVAPSGPPPTLNETLVHLRRVGSSLPRPEHEDVVRSKTLDGETALPLDADELSQPLAVKLYELLLRPDCPSPAVSKRLLFKVLLAAIDALHDGEPCVQLPLPEAHAKLVIVGDTHGQLQDVLTIWMAHGLPSAQTRYLFNGDVADRSPHAVEIYALYATPCASNTTLE